MQLFCRGLQLLAVLNCIHNEPSTGIQHYDWATLCSLSAQG